MMDSNAIAARVRVRGKDGRHCPEARGGRGRFLLSTPGASGCGVAVLPSAASPREPRAMLFPNSPGLNAGVPSPRIHAGRCDDDDSLSQNIPR